jgi:hypothetical protein
VNLNLNFGNLTNSLRSLWDELVERRLWPVAIALVVALVALPVLLSKPSAQAPSVPPAPTGTAGVSSPLGAFQPAVSTEGRKSSEIRKNLKSFNAKNPFTPQGGSSSGGNAAGTATPVGATGAGSVTFTGTGPTGTGSTGTGSTGSGTATIPGTSGSTTTPGTTAKTTYFTYTVDVRFGKTGQLDAKTLTNFRALPSSDDPIIVFMGVRTDGKTAVFLVSANATTTGDGDCSPSDDQCTFLHLKKGDTRTIEAVGQDNQVTDYQLVLRDVNVKKVEAPKATSSKSERSASKAQEPTPFTRKVRSFERLGF